MNNSGSISRLGIKVTAVAFIALSVAFGVYLLIYEIVVPKILYGERFSKYWAEREVVALEDFRKYVNDNSLTMQEAIQDTHWTKTHHTIYPYVEKYNPESEEWYSSEEYTKRTIQCTDGVVYAFFYPSTGYYFNIGRITALSVALICFFLCSLPYTYRIVHRIVRLSREMEVLAGGDLSYKVVSTGRDELAELGRSIEGMRCAFLKQMSRENESVLANNQLITSLSHDLRTPLTKLTGYLEILRYKKYKDENEHDLYLSKALEKAGQMQTLSDEMFRNFQVKHPGYTGAGNQSHEYIPLKQVVEMLMDQCHDLQGDGFRVDVTTVDKPCFVQICGNDLQRIFDNLFSNLRKYADKDQLISITANEVKDGVEIVLRNSIRVQSEVSSTGIGLPTVQSLLLKNNGKLKKVQTGNTFSIRLLLNVAK